MEIQINYQDDSTIIERKKRNSRTYVKRSEEYYFSWLRRATCECFDDIIYTNLLGILLDVGCGRGVYLQKYSKKLKSLVGLDLNIDKFQQIREHLRKNINLIIASALNLPFRHQIFYYLICTELLEHLDAPSKCISEISRVLKEKGHALISTPNLLTIPPHPITIEHLSYVSSNRLKTICKYFNLEFKRHVGTSFKFPIVRLGNKVTYFYSIFDKISNIFRNICKEFTQTIVMSFEKNTVHMKIQKINQTKIQKSSIIYLKPVDQTLHANETSSQLHQ